MPNSLGPGGDQRAERVLHLYLVTSYVSLSYLRRLLRLRVLGVRSNVFDVSPVADARERRDARGIGTEEGVDKCGRRETGHVSRLYCMGGLVLGVSLYWKPID